ncbi:hypothetical protein EST38_g10219 [Candolleomyces aberdarensis]|uniref:Cytochrome P450 n=1 Tax=Candolleomyces aberdarensis TaxID=2316362 RepID=A0A4Q2D7X8_9AGAR|nr:hypothetical protein EST38_g10219 [Candolleomyces aberdarensis]
MLYVYDPKALHHIVVKDSNVYEEPLDFFVVTRKIFGMGLLSTEGAHHRKQRKLLTPVFSIAHMRGMVPTFFEIANKTRKAFLLKVNKGEKEIEVASWMTRTALELIGQSGFGYSFDSLEEGSKMHPYAASIKGLTGATNDAPVMIGRIVLLPYVDLIPPKTQRAIIDFLPWKEMHIIRDMVDIMTNTSMEIYEATKREVMENDGLGRKDIMSVLVKANNAASEEDRIPESELVAQISTIIFAAMDTTSNALSRILHLLSEHPEVQERLRTEIRDAFENHGELDYDTLSSLPYLDAVCRESLRVHTPVPYLTREANSDIVLPLDKPITSTDGKQMDSIFVPKGTRILISLLKCNTDPEIWGPDAHEWKPERWISPLPDRVPEARVPGIYSHLMTFSGGNRACIGFKFSQLEMKAVLSTLIQTFRFAPSDRRVIWEWNNVVQPTTEDAEITANGTRKLQLPLKVTLV